MENLNIEIAQIIRSFASRWSRFQDVVSGLHALEDGGRSKLGEFARRVLDNARHRTTYPEAVINALRSDRANALAALRQPLAEAIGHIITIEVTTAALKVENENQRSRMSRELAGELKDTHQALLNKLHELGVSYGHYSVLQPEHVAAIAKYILRKAQPKVDAISAAHRGWNGRSSKKPFYWTPKPAPNNPRRDEGHSNWSPPEQD